MGSKIIEEVKISKKMLEQIDALRDSERTPPKQFTDEQDAIILKYFVSKNKKDLAKLIGCCQSTMRKRYQELTNGQSKK